MSYEGVVDPDSAAAAAGLALDQSVAVIPRAQALAAAAASSAATAAASAAEAKAAQAAFGITYRFTGTVFQARTPDGSYGPEADLQGPQGGIGLTPSIQVGYQTKGQAAVVRRAGSPDEAPILDFTLPPGADGWTPVLGLVADGIRRVQQVVDWTGGTGLKPTPGLYIGGSGFVVALADAVDVRGPSVVTSAFGASFINSATAADAKATLALAVGDVAGAAPSASPILTGTPTAPTAPLGTNTTQIATMAALQAAVAGLINSAPGALDTLKELADAIGDDPNFATTVTNALAAKLAKSANLSDVIDKSAARGNLGLTIGSNVQAWDTDLDAIAALGTTAFGRGLLTQASVATLQTLLSLATVATTGSYNDLTNKPVIPTAFTRGQIVAAAYGDPLNFF